jgi:hypothetical protein
MGKQRHKRGTLGAATPLPSLVLPPPTPFWRVVTLPTLAALAVVASVWFYLHSAEKPRILAKRPPAKKVRAAWKPITEKDRLVDAFRKARNVDAKSTLNLAPDPVFDGKPVSEAEGEAMQAHYILHRIRQIVAIRSGEPGEGMAWLDTHRYTLKTREPANAPKVAVKVGDRVGPLRGLTMLNPDIVVEVRDGKIHALRAELNRE